MKILFSSYYKRNRNKELTVPIEFLYNESCTEKYEVLGTNSNILSLNTNGHYAQSPQETFLCTDINPSPESYGEISFIPVTVLKLNSKTLKAPIDIFLGENIMYAVQWIEKGVELGSIIICKDSLRSSDTSTTVFHISQKISDLKALIIASVGVGGIYVFTVSGTVVGNDIVFTRNDTTTYTVLNVVRQDIHVVSGTMSGVNLILLLSDGSTVPIANVMIPEIHAVSGSMSGSTLTITNNDGSSFNIANVRPPDSYVTSGAVVGNDIVLQRNNGLPPIIIVGAVPTPSTPVDDKVKVNGGSSKELEDSSSIKFNSSARYSPERAYLTEVVNATSKTISSSDRGKLLVFDMGLVANDIDIELPAITPALYNSGFFIDLKLLNLTTTEEIVLRCNASDEFRDTVFYLQNTSSPISKLFRKDLPDGSTVNFVSFRLSISKDSSNYFWNIGLSDGDKSVNSNILIDANLEDQIVSSNSIKFRNYYPNTSEISPNRFIEAVDIVNMNVDILEEDNGRFITLYNDSLTGLLVTLPKITSQMVIDGWFVDFKIKLLQGSTVSFTCDGVDMFTNKFGFNEDNYISTNLIYIEPYNSTDMEAVFRVHAKYPMLGNFYWETSHKYLEVNQTLYRAVTYTELLNLKNDNKLVAGESLLLIDYQTIHMLQKTYTSSPLTDEIEYIAPLEPLLLKAISSNTLSNVAHSLYFPNHIINYCIEAPYPFFRDSTSNSKGVIYYRKDENGNERDFDFIGCRFPRWEYTILGNTGFISPVPTVGSYALYKAIDDSYEVTSTKSLSTSDNEYEIDNNIITRQSIYGTSFNNPLSNVTIIGFGNTIAYADCCTINKVNESYLDDFQNEDAVLDNGTLSYYKKSLVSGTYVLTLIPS